MSHHITHFEIVGDDQNLLEDFYGRVFDWKIQPVMEGYSMVFPGEGIRGGIGRTGIFTHKVTFYVHVEDVEAALAAVEASGGHKAYGPFPIPDGSVIAHFADPEGNVIGIIQPPKPA
jgi:predicted enzyme related to lactoylglutathione lyase